MADEKRDSDPAPDLAQDVAAAAKRRRPAPTIDLKATEIASEPATPPQPSDFSQETPENAAHVEAAAPPVASISEGESAAQADPAPGASKEAPRWGRPAWRLSAASAPPAGDGEKAPGLRARIVNRLGFRALTAAGISAALTLCAVVALWLVAGPSSNDERADALAARMTVLEMKLGDVARKSAQEAGPAAPGDLASRVGKIEQTAGGLAALEGRLAKIEQGAGAAAALDARIARLEKAPLSQTGAAPNNQALTDRIAALETALGDAKGRADAAFDAAQKNTAPSAVVAADHKDIDALTTRVSALEQAVKGADERIARAASTGTDKAGRFAFVAQALRETVERGDPFVTELAAVKPLANDPAQIAALEPFAASGVPRAATLGREFSQLASPMLTAVAPPREGGIMDRLQQSAARLVRIRPINEMPGDDPATVISRAEVKATKGDLAGALTDLSRLPDAARAPAKDWMKKAETQVAAIAAARRLADAAVSGLAKP